jgi:small subunit ribosomal protein S8
MRHDLFSDTLNIINNAEGVGKSQCNVPVSKFIQNVLETIKKNGYISDFSHDESKRNFVVFMAGKINKIKSIKPRFSVKKNEYDEWERKYLPGKNVGILIISTSQGIMSQKEAVEKNLGGKIVAYVY